MILILVLQNDGRIIQTKGHTLQFRALEANRVLGQRRTVSVFEWTKVEAPDEAVQEQSEQVPVISRR